MADNARFGDSIGPANLLALVDHAAPFLAAMAPPDAGERALVDLAADPKGWLAIVRAGNRLPAVRHPSPLQRLDYFALCLASHWATVASYCPTDVDAKIRGRCWSEPKPDVLRAQVAVVRAARTWDVRAISARWIDAPDGPIGGHQGEWLGVAVGALGGLLRAGIADQAEEIAAAIDGELAREAAEFRRRVEGVRAGGGGEVELLRLAALMTHNVGDVDQGLAYWDERTGEAWRVRLRRLAHDNTTPYDGAYQTAALLYKRLLAAEGHRHYPLRAVKALRRSADLLLPIGPFFDDWGRRVASHESLSPGDRAEVLEALIVGCRKVPGQMGYQRAIAGMASAQPLDRLAKRLSDTASQGLHDVQIRHHLGVRQETFEADLAKQARALIATPS